VQIVVYVHSSEVEPLIARLQDKVMGDMCWEPRWQCLTAVAVARSLRGPRCCYLPATDTKAQAAIVAEVEAVAVVEDDEIATEQDCASNSSIHVGVMN